MRSRARPLIGGILTSVALAVTTSASAERISLPGLNRPAAIVRDANGIAHIRARNAQDLYFLQGWVHAEDRLYQMDQLRRAPSGTLAELLGPPVLASDVELRTIGLRRAAERSLPVLSAETQEALEAYAAGVNAWVAQADSLPPEYEFLGLDKADFAPWTPVDSVVMAKVLAFQLSFDLDTGLTEDLQAYLAAFPGNVEGALALFTQDMYRSQPFDCAATVPDATGAFPFTPVGEPDPWNARCLGATPVVTAKQADARRTAKKAARSDGASSPALAHMASRASAKLRRSEFIRKVLDADGQIGSNEWGVTASLGANGRPVIANDPHLALGTPSTFYPNHLIAGKLNVYGSSFAGVPFVVLGHNERIHWGATTNPMDVTDTFVELLVIDPETGLPSATLFQGNPEPVELVPEAFFFNAGGGLAQAPPGPCMIPGCPTDGEGNPTLDIPAATVIVPRRNNGPIIATFPELAQGGAIPALSVQYTGFAATRELDTFRLWNEARDLEDFREALQYFDVGSQNWVYTDVDRNVAYFTSAEMPLRADLQACDGSAPCGPAPGTVPGFFPPGVPVPPWLIRDGTSGQHEWLPATSTQPGQAIAYEILPYEEMPQTVNPSAGWFVNANNDPAGTTLDNDPLNQLRQGGQGIYYLNPGYAGGFRAGTITRRVRALEASQGQFSVADMQDIQADVSLLDASYFVAFIVAAFDNAGQAGKPAQLATLAADPAIAEAVARLAAWDFTTPTGIREGYDAGDPPEADWRNLPAPSQQEIDTSVAATIYSVWRGQAVQGIIDATLGDLPKPGSSQAVAALRQLLDTFGITQGRGVAGAFAGLDIDFFAVEGIADPADRRDYKLLAALDAALDLLAGDEFAAAFGNSDNQDDYRWGKLHRIVFDHPFVPPFSLPSQASLAPQPVPGLPGYPTDGGFGVVDASSHSARADSVNDFMFGSGPVRRYAGEPTWRFGSRAESIWAGGTSGYFFVGNRFYSNLLPFWLSNETLPLSLRLKDAKRGASSITRFKPVL